MIYPCPSWYQDAKFGLFFHWGPYCVPAYRNEWYSRNMYATHTEQSRYHMAHYGSISQFGYNDFIPLFTGEAFDPDAWADLVVLSGARYAGPVSEQDVYKRQSKYCPAPSTPCGVLAITVTETGYGSHDRLRCV